MPTVGLAAPTAVPTRVIAAPSALPTPGVIAAPSVLPTQVLSIPTASPTGALATPSLMPSYRVAAPTVLPTPVAATPTAVPTVVVAAPTAMPGFYCSSYSTSNTNSDTTNYAVCPITACPGDTVTMTTIAAGSCNGDTYLRLYDQYGYHLAYNDDYYGVCSQITYTFSASCQTYELREGCFGSISCGGRIYYFGSSAVSQSPIAIVTAVPTGVRAAPTSLPTHVISVPTVSPPSPSIEPIVAPSSHTTTSSSILPYVIGAIVGAVGIGCCFLLAYGIYYCWLRRRTPVPALVELSDIYPIADNVEVLNSIAPVLYDESSMETVAGAVDVTTIGVGDERILHFDFNVTLV